MYSFSNTWGYDNKCIVFQILGAMRIPGYLRILYWDTDMGILG